MLKTLISSFILLFGYQTYSQTNADSLMLSVYHLGTKYRLTPAAFGTKVMSENLLGEMILAYDTILHRVPFGIDTAAGQSLTGFKVEHNCDKITKDLKDKVVVIALNSNCDPTQTCLKIQREGAKAVILIHTINERDSIELKGGLYADSIKIPCYTVRRDIGKLITTMLPALVGIKKPDIMPDDAMALKSNPISNNNPSPQASVEKLNTTKEAIVEDKIEITIKESLKISKTNLIVYPNPANNTATLAYELERSVDLDIEVANEVGQVIERRKLNTAEMGIISFDCHNWANGIYFINLKGEAINETRKIFINH